MEGPFVICDLYNRIFSSQISTPELQVDYMVWNQIFSSLPDHYQLPDHEVLNITKQ
ncbi:hypothetical protein J2Z32_001723 [Paenibacillus turicensis]|uniref:Uncharacterized protein n=1 Tax=Paenibacillus turicensis TaxID=160487 RepID=A0ABS4FRZ2_9BACL|nr:hypothetical protein [Paenibacillus turicensis]MBP1905098.1 hypothetical protein [Paenibacillus turicensis]